ncbi:Meiotic recombination protein SPO11-2 [Porphyridium purpureum]|uniref:Meiotic recombination protein SPO11-2 n=1 Tax=Porphyridium purpureum TaxID=35688 RepID=A0A5J4Z116_PORPP|nr:Meiotic recombination protein SPO11-2 [Porphyridium purpureum]|eukprot:POR9118..scf208_2
MEIVRSREDPASIALALALEPQSQRIRIVRELEAIVLDAFDLSIVREGRRLRYVTQPLQYVRFLAIVTLVHRHVLSGESIALRSVFYELEDLFPNQVACDRVVMSLARRLQVDRTTMNIVPASDGVFAGLIDVRFGTAVAGVSGQLLQGSAANAEGHKIPGKLNSISQMRFVVSEAAQFILLIEKHGVFMALVESYISPEFGKAPVAVRFLGLRADHVKVLSIPRYKFKPLRQAAAKKALNMISSDFALGGEPMSEELLFMQEFGCLQIESLFDDGTEWFCFDFLARVVIRRMSSGFSLTSGL